MDSPSKRSQHSEQAEEEGKGQVTIRLFSSLPSEFQIPDEPLVVEGEMQRRGLSQLINDLLESSSPTPFDFLVSSRNMEGEEKEEMYLRESLSSLCRTQGWSSEKVIELEYVFAMPKPESEEMDTQDDWVLHLSPLSPSSFYSASGDGSICLYENQKKVSKFQESNFPVSALYSRKVEGDRVVVSGNKDRIIRMSLNEKKIFESDVLESTPTALWLSSDCSYLLAGFFSGKISVFNVPDFSGIQEKSEKKRGVEVDPLSLRFEFSEKHSQEVTGFLVNSKNELFSSSFDLSILKWDLFSGEKLGKIHAGKAVTAFQSSQNFSMLATGHEDGRIAFWKEEGEEWKLLEAYKSHSQLTSSLSWHPSHPSRIASSSLDGTIKIFDSRSPRLPLQSLKIDEKVKVLVVRWLDDETLVSGGSDGKVRTHRVKLT